MTSPVEATISSTAKASDEYLKRAGANDDEVIINLTELDTFEEPPPEAIPETPDTISDETPALRSPESPPLQTTPSAATPSPPQSTTPVPGSTNNNGEFYDPVFHCPGKSNSTRNRSRFFRSVLTVEGFPLSLFKVSTVSY